MRTKMLITALATTILFAVGCQKEPTACFDCYEIGQACGGHDYEFTNCSTEATTYKWEFGDGGTSTLALPHHCYSSGTYTVTLTAYSENGKKTDVFTKTINP